jgi:hypothetical protein
VAALVLLGTSACNFVAPQATSDMYEPSDGTATTVGDVKVANALLISADGDEANLVASFINKSDSRVRLTLQYESGSKKVDETVTVGARQAQRVGGDGVEVMLENIDAKPGDLFPIYLQYGDAEGKQLLVPVLDGTQPEYADLLP